MEEIKKTPVVEQCKECFYVQDDDLCKVYYWPESKWGDARACPMCTTRAPERIEEDGRSLDPIKQSKRKSKNKK
jgi:hypothetical protein